MSPGLRAALRRFTLGYCSIGALRAPLNKIMCIKGRHMTGRDENKKNRHTHFQSPSRNITVLDMTVCVGWAVCNILARRAWCSSNKSGKIRPAEIHAVKMLLTLERMAQAWSAEEPMTYPFPQSTVCATNSRLPLKPQASRGARCFGRLSEKKSDVLLRITAAAP